MRSLHVVVLDKGLRDAACLLQGGRPIQGQALLLIASMVPLDEPILLGVTRRTDLDINAQTGTKAQQGRRKVTACRTSNPSGIPIQGDLVWQTILGQGQCQGRESRFRRKIGADVSIQQHRGTHINDVEGLHDVLPLAIRIGGHTAHIFESICQHVIGAGRSCGSCTGFSRVWIRSLALRTR